MNSDRPPSLEVLRALNRTVSSGNNPEEILVSLAQAFLFDSVFDGFSIVRMPSAQRVCVDRREKRVKNTIFLKIEQYLIQYRAPNALPRTIHSSELSRQIHVSASHEDTLGVLMSFAPGSSASSPSSLWWVACATTSLGALSEEFLREIEELEKDISRALSEVILRAAQLQSLEDQAERLKVEHTALRERFSRIAQSVPGAIVTYSMSPEGVFSMPFATPAIESMTGLTLQTLNERAEEWGARVPVESLQENIIALRRSAGEHTRWHARFPYHHPSLGTRVHEAWGVPQSTPDGSTHWDGFVMDITDRVAAEQALAKSEEMYRWLFDHMLNGFCLCKVVYEGERIVDWEYVNVNDAFFRLSALPAAVGKRFSELAPGAFAQNQRLVTSLERVMQERTAESFEFYIPDADRWFSVSLYYANHQHFIALIEGITERKKAEAASHDARERLQIALDAAELGTWTTDFVTGLVTLDERACAHFDLDDAVVPLSVFQMRCHPLDLEAHRAVFDRLSRVTGASGEKSRAAIEHRVVRRDGSVRWISCRIETLYSSEGPKRGYVAVATSRDISEQKVAQDALKTSEERYRALVDNLEVVILSIDLDGYITFASQAVGRYGYSPSSLVGKRWLDLVFADDIQAVQSSREAQIASGALQPIEFRLVDDSAKVRSVRATFRPLIVDARFIGMMGVLVDLTAQRDTEEQLRAAQKMEAVGRLAGGVAHDFNNLLSVILSYTELAVMELHHEDLLRADLEEVIQAAKRAESLTRQLLAFSRRQMLRPELLDLSQTVLSLGKMLRRLIGEDIELAMDIPAQAFPVQADRGQIEQVIMNLLVNARDAMPDGGRVRIWLERVRLDAEQARVLDSPPGEYVCLSVSDTGCGMDSAVLAKIFEPFFTTKEVGKGTGLGLSMVYGIVRQSGGAIRVTSEVGRGATFSVFLPLRVESPVEDRESPSSLESSRGHETILVVEDEIALKSLVARVLTTTGYKVFTAANPGEALLVCEKHGARIDVILTDVVMPGINGKELVDRVLPLCPKAKVLFVSGYTADVLERHGIDELHFLAKPFDLHTLTTRIRRLLDTK
ncbi:MAG: PAS domain S-box protein [Polyangiaceae bacterium]